MRHWRVFIDFASRGRGGFAIMSCLEPVSAGIEPISADRACHACPVRLPGTARLAGNGFSLAKRRNTAWRPHRASPQGRACEPWGVGSTEIGSKHSQQELRYHALGRTDDDRLLHATFTLRGDGTLVRVISARDMHRKERSFYEQARQDAP
jgi:hypothetical protein